MSTNEITFLVGFSLVHWCGTPNGKEVDDILRMHQLLIKTNKTGTSQVGAISKAQKAQNIFFWKKT